MNMNTLDILSPHEEKCFKTRYSDCNKYTGTQDIVFCYPLQLFNGNPTKVCNNIQRAFDILNRMGLYDRTPTYFFGQRTVIGFLRNCCAGWGPNWINIPWESLTQPETSPVSVHLADQVEFTCSHEIVHPFETMFLGNNSNKKWKEGFCDFLRVVLLKEMGLLNYAQQWEEVILSATKNGECDVYHDTAGRISNWCRYYVGPKNKITISELSYALKNLIVKSMDNELDPNNEIRWTNS